MWRRSLEVQFHNNKISGSSYGVNPQCSRDPAHIPRVPQRTNYPLQSIPKVVLKIMLCHLTCIIFTYYRSTCGRCLECSHNYLQCKQLASHLPPTHKRVFDYLTGWLFFKISITSYNSSAFLREVLSHSAKNGIDPKILATLFCNLFLRVTLSLFDLLPT